MKGSFPHCENVSRMLDVSQQNVYTLRSQPSNTSQSIPTLNGVSKLLNCKMKMTFPEGYFPLERKPVFSCMDPNPAGYGI